MTLQPGDMLETAIWCDGTETEKLKDRFETDLQASLAGMADAEGVIIGPLIMTEKKPGEDRVPPVPDEIHGPDVMLLVGEAQVIGEAFQLRERSVASVSEGLFVADLEPKDLERLRTILRRVHRHYNPGKSELSQEKCDEYINCNGPAAALEALREQVGVKVH